MSSEDFFKGKTIVALLLRRARRLHLDLFVQTSAELRQYSTTTLRAPGRGSRISACISVNDSVCDAFAWGDQSKTAGKVTMLADGNGDFARALGLEADMTKNGMGKRSRRYSMLVEDGVVKQLNLEEPGAFGVSSGDHLLNQL